MKMIPVHTLDYLDSWLTLRSRWESIPGFSVAIAKDGEIVFSHSYGRANLETEEIMHPNHLFRVASHSKTFTATAVLQLQEQGKLRIDDQIIAHLGWLAEHSDSRWKAVTIRQLLSHSAGIVRDGVDSDFWNLRRSFPDRDVLREEILRTDLVYEPNTKLKYSNYGYGILGELIEQASGMSYAEYVKKNIIDAVGLKYTYPDLSNDMLSQLATGYSRLNLSKGRFAFPHIHTNALAAATGFCSTAGDLAIFFSALRIGTGQLLRDESKREMRRMQWQSTYSDEGYALGLSIQQAGGRSLVGHGGGLPGFITRSYLDIDDGLAVVVCSNGYDAWSTSIAKAVYALIDLFGEEAPREEHAKFEGRFSTFFGVSEVIATAQGLRMIYPNSWYPIDDISSLSVVDDTTLRIAETDSYSSGGELIHYVFSDDGSIQQVTEAGSVLMLSSDGDIRQIWT